MNKEIKSELKEMGLEMVDVAVPHVFEIAKIAIKESENKVDDMALIILPQIEKSVKSYMEKQKNA